MWSQLKIALSALSLMALLGACGFTPMYAKQPKGEPALAGRGVFIDVIGSERAQYQLRNELEDKLNPSGRVPPFPAYRLTATFQTRVSAIGVSTDGTVSRYNVYLSSEYELKDYSTDEVVTRGNLEQVNSYNNRINEYYSTYISSEDAIKRGVMALAETYRQRLAPFLNGQRLPQDEADEQRK